MFLLTDYFFSSFILFLSCADFTSIFISSGCLVFGVFFCSSVNLTASFFLYFFSAWVGIETCLLSTRSSVGGQEHVKGQTGGRLDLKASSG